MGMQTKYDAAPGWSAQLRIGSYKTSAGPRCARWNGTDYVVWREKKNSNIYCSSGSEGSWSNPSVQPQGGTQSAPAIAVFNDSLFVAWRGSNDDYIWYSSFDGNTWTDQVALYQVPTTSFGPAVATYNNTLYMAWRGMDGMIWYATYDGSNWSSAQQVSNPSKLRFDTLTSPALAADDNALHLGWIDGSRTINHAIYSGQWSVPHALPSAQSGAGPALTGYDNGLAMFWWVSSGNGLYWSTCPNGTEDWSNPVRITDGGTDDSPGVCSDATGIRAVWRGAGSDSGIWTSTLAAPVICPVPPAITGLYSTQIYGTVQKNTYVTVTVTPPGGSPTPLPVTQAPNGSWSINLDPPATNNTKFSATASFGSDGTPSDPFVRVMGALYEQDVTLTSVGETKVSGSATAGWNVLGWRASDGSKMVDLTLSGNTGSFNTSYVGVQTLPDTDLLCVVSADPDNGSMTIYNNKPEGYTSS